MERQAKPNTEGGWLTEKWRKQIVRVNPMVKCTYCSFVGPNHKAHFATCYRPTRKQQKLSRPGVRDRTNCVNLKPCCHPCCRKRKAERFERKCLEARLKFQERRRRRLAKMSDKANAKTKSKDPAHKKYWNNRRQEIQNRKYYIKTRVRQQELRR